MKPLRPVAVAAALVGIVVIGAQLDAGPPPVGKVSGIIAAEDVAPLVRSTGASSAGTSTSLNYSTGFEPGQGFTARDGTCVQDTVNCPGGYTGQCGFIGDGTQGSGPYPEPWAVSNSNSGNIEGHIETVHPFSGVQHLRFSRDLCDDTNAFGFSVDARVPASPPLPGVIAPVTVSAQIAMTSGLFGANLSFQPQAISQGLVTARMIFDFYGTIYVLTKAGFCFPGGLCGDTGVYWDASGGYRQTAIHSDPCTRFRCTGGPNFEKPCPNGHMDCRECVGGDRDGSPCRGDFECTGGGACQGGYCAGRIDYFYDTDGDGIGDLIATETAFAGTTVEQVLFYTDNFRGDADIDDVTIETGEPCPTECGNLDVEFGEHCDGENDTNCPARCVPPGETGPDGEPECTCVIEGEFCEEAIEIPNGSTEYVSPGGWWTFTADTTATAIDFCGTLDYDSAFYLWTGTCNTLEFVAVDDDCMPWKYGGGYADPLAPCYFVDPWPPWPACTCAPTTPGQQYWVYDWRVRFAETTVIAKSKRLDCFEIWEDGACCDGYGNCTDDVAESDCQSPGEEWSGQKLCTTVEPCEVTLGTCCDHGPGLGGACVDAVELESCTGVSQEFKLDEQCGDTPCLEVRGACCNGFTGDCAQTIRDDCRSLSGGRNMVWTRETPCAQVACDPIPGACLDRDNPDPLSRACLCTNGVIQADCQGDKLEWVKGASCATVQPSCVPNFNSIPTVAEWGLVVLTLLLLVGGKLAFGAKRVA